MMAIATTTPGGEPRAFGLPLLTRLLPGLVSAIALLPASLALEFHGMVRVLLPLLIIQGSLLAFGACVLALAAHDRLCQWESRAAPLSARARVRAGLLGDLWRMGATGAAGPLVLALMLAWRGDSWEPVRSALAVPAGCLCGGLVVPLSWHGRAPRLLLVPALAGLAVLLGAPGGGDVGDGWHLLAVAAATVLLWRWLTSSRALAMLSPPLPWPRPAAWLRRTTAYQTWRVTSGLEPTAPARQNTDRYRFAGVLLPLMWLPQLVGQADRLRWFSWGRVYDGAYDGIIYGGCMLLVALIAASCYVAPPLHWRLRLAPRRMSPQRWAVRMVLGSMAAAVVLFTVALALVALFHRDGSQHINAGTWLSVTGDVLLASSFLHWQRGRRCPAWLGLAIILGTPALMAALLYGLVWLGFAPQRGPVWLALQLALTVPLTLAAIRAWSRRDLNEVS
ncbi:MAG: hypothetical protein HY020_14705 [Burkholderiales bacterium]|nr:hypothetical protein [Burkholderiales bacterium]